MKHAEIKMMVAELAPVIRQFVAAAVGPISERLDALETRVSAIPVPKIVDENAIVERMAGNVKAQIAEFREIVSQQIKTAHDRIESAEEKVAEQRARDNAQIQDWMDSVDQRFKALSEPKDGKDADPEVIRQMVEKAVSALPSPKDGVGLASAMIDRDGELVVTLSDGKQQKLGVVVGKGVDEAEIVTRVAKTVTDEIAAARKDLLLAIESVPAAPELPDVGAMISDAIKSLPAPVTRDDVKGMLDEAVKSIPVPDVESIVDSRVEKAISALPKPKDGEPGKSVTVEDVAPLVAAEVQRAVAEIPKPKDGNDGRGLAGMLIDRDGELVATMTDGRTEKLGRVVGRDGRDADMAALERHITEAVAAIPRPKDGADGVGFDDMDLEVLDEGAFLKFVKGERVKRFPVPLIIDRGVFKEGQPYRKGASVTWGGCIWIAQKDTTDKPGTSDAWRLSVKKGRDGKDAK